MDAFVAHVQAHWQGYAVLLVILAPLLYVFRRQTTPVIMWTVEITIYMGCLHIVIHYLVILTRWFKTQSTIRYINNGPLNLGWETPLLDFWQREQYYPAWLFYVELVFFVTIVVLVLRYRPYRFKNVRQRMRDTDTKRGKYNPPRPKTGAYK